MKAEIITIGDELLIGQVVDTNSAWMGQKLNEIGVSVSRITSIGDDKAQIVSAINDAFSFSDVILVTGGLGPTKDDITKKTLAEYFNCGFKTDKETLARVKSLVERRGIPFSDINRMQADVPESCEVIQNHNGTAPCMLFRKNGKVLISMPGVPFEMKSLMEESILDLLAKEPGNKSIIHKTIMTTGIPESALAKKIEAWENSLPSDIKLAYLPSLQGIRLRLSSYDSGNAQIADLIDEKIGELNKIIKDNIFSYKDETLEVAVDRLLKGKKVTLSTAESCTGGTVASTLVKNPGASTYFMGGIVSYSNEAKQSILHVKDNTLAAYGAVSEQVVKQMAEGARKLLNTDYAIATSGIAGPDGGTEKTPVGTTWIAVASEKETVAEVFNFGNNRERTMERATAAALNMLRKQVLKFE